MAFIYRCIDKSDNIIKYIGIVTEATRSLQDRIIEHHHKDMWFSGRNWKIQYFIVDSKTDAELFEAHLIALYDTGKYFNKSKSNWGKSIYLPDISNEWIDLDIELPDADDDDIEISNSVNEIVDGFLSKALASSVYYSDKIKNAKSSEIRDIRDRSNVEVNQMRKGLESLSMMQKIQKDVNRGILPREYLRFI